MQIEERQSGQVTVIRVNGDITLNKGGDVLLKDKVQSLLQQGKKKLLLDLGNVSYVDSAGLGQLRPARPGVRHDQEPRRVAQAAEPDQAPQGSARRLEAADGVRQLRVGS